jgi:uncharacterized protein YqjF (DUF2071 family)
MPLTFLRAEWRHLLIVNYEVDPAILRPRVPAGCELDLFEGKALVSLVGFRFLNTRLLGRLPVPFHVNFDEFNLRFYVLRRAGSDVRRGVTFVTEYVPRWAIATTARLLYEEPYRAVPMRHALNLHGPRPEAAYSLKVGGRWHTLAGAAEGPSIYAPDDPAISFITEHYWGYTQRRSGQASEYQVIHPPWQVRRAPDARFEGDGGSLYGPEWREWLAAKPHSACLAEGSEVAVMGGAGVR